MRIRRSFLTFRLRTLLVLVGTLCAILAWRVHQVRSRELALEALSAAEADIGYRDEKPRRHIYIAGTTLEQIAYYQNSGRADTAFSDWRTGESGLDWSHRLRLFIFGDPNSIYSVLLGDVEGQPVRQERARIDDALQQLPAVEEVVHLDLEGSPVSESALQRVGRLRSLEHLYLIGTQTSDRTLKQIGGLTRLERLAIGSPHVTARGLEELRTLHNLLWLELNECTFSDDCVDVLQHLKALRQLALPTTVSEEATQHLRKLLPQCNIVRGDAMQLNSSGLPPPTLPVLGISW